MALDCLDTLVGLSKVEYPCFGAAPDGFDTSDSGYHLTDPDYGLTVIDQCELDGYTLLQNALDQAIREFKTDLQAKLRTKFDGRIKAFRGQIGKLTSSGALTVSTDYIGVRIRVIKQAKGAKWVFKKIYLGLNASVSTEITIKSNDPNFVEPTPVAITTTANAFASATTAIELPLWSYADFDAGEYLEYYLTIPRGSARPLNNNFTCCGKIPEWKQYFEVNGLSSNVNHGTSGNYGTNAMGFALDGFFTCEELDWICDLEELNGYHLRGVIARAIQMRGSAIAISELVDSLAVNPCTGYQLENLNARRTVLNKGYQTNLDWVVENMPDGLTDCFVCKPVNQFHKQKMLV